MLLRWKHIAALLVALPVAAILGAWLGIFDVRASSGHWKVTDWFLHFAMQSSVRTYALGVTVPEKLPVDAIQPAAGHFARGCAICHGAPGEPRSATAMAMLPPPPDLTALTRAWTDAQLFQIAKHGIRYTGMPAWPTLDRDDEIWAMVAFLRELPSMDAKAYRDLAYGMAGPPTAGLSDDFDRTLADCARCHGLDGIGRSPFVPIIAGQNEIYLIESLRAYAERARASGMMALPTTATSEDQFAALAQHFAKQAVPAPEAADATISAAGKQIAEQGLPERKIPACLGCHGGKNPAYPKLDGQHAEYLAGQLRLFREGKRGGGRFSHLMEQPAKGLSDADIAAVAAFFSSRTPSGL